MDRFFQIDKDTKDIARPLVSLKAFSEALKEENTQLKPVFDFREFNGIGFVNVILGFEHVKTGTLFAYKPKKNKKDS